MDGYWVKGRCPKKKTGKCGNFFQVGPTQLGGLPDLLQYYIPRGGEGVFRDLQIVLRNGRFQKNLLTESVRKGGTP